jgi:hypothetical protein
MKVVKTHLSSSESFISLPSVLESLNRFELQGLNVCVLSIIHGALVRSAIILRGRALGGDWAWILPCEWD